MLQRFHAPDEIPSRGGKGAYFMPGTGIHMSDYAPSVASARAVMRHETGHYVDDRIGSWKRRSGGDAGMGISDGRAGTAAMEASRNRLIEMQKDYYHGARQRHPEVLAGRRHSRTAVTAARIRDQQSFIDEAGGVAQAQRAARRELAEGDDIWALANPHISDNQVIAAASAKRHDDLTALVGYVDLDHPSGIMMADLLGALTKNRIGFGHTNRYYDARRGWGRQHEAFANAFDLLDYVNGSLPREFLRLLAPDWADFVERLLEEAVNAGS